MPDMTSRSRVRAIAASLALGGVALLAGACGSGSVSTGPSGPATSMPMPSFDKGGTHDHFNEKFEFTDVDLSDAGGPADATIRAGSKKTNNGQDTDCGYFTSADAFLGEFDSQAFASADPDAVLSFCVSHFGDRAGA